MKSDQTVQDGALPTAVAELLGNLGDGRFSHVLVFFHFIICLLLRMPL
jgi:hypothetical protein